LTDINIWIGSSLDMMDLCTNYGGLAASGETVHLNCSYSIPGQYLKLTGGDSDSECDNYVILQFCEIDVVGYFPGICFYHEKFHKKVVSEKNKRICMLMFSL